MRPLQFLLFAAVAATASATASLQRRQDNSITIDNTVLSGSLCSADTASMLDSTDGNTMTVGFSEYILVTSDGVTSGDCNLDMTLIYPPGCSTALMNVDLHSFFQGVEGVMTVMNVTISLSTNRHSIETEVYRNEGQALEDGQAPYLRSYPMDASLSFNQEEPAEVNLSISLGAQIESENENPGIFSLDDISISFITSDLDSDWENCIQTVARLD